MKLIVRCTVHKSRLCRWGKFTMGIREAARAASFIRPDIVIPCHYGLEVGQLADIDELGRAVKFLSSSTNVAALASG